MVEDNKKFYCGSFRITGKRSYMGPLDVYAKSIDSAKKKVIKSLNKKFKYKNKKEINIRECKMEEIPRSWDRVIK